METLVSLIGTWVTDPQSQQVLFVGLVAGAIFILALGLSVFFVGATDPVRRRLSEAGDQEERDSERRRKLTINTVVGPVAHWVMPSSETERSGTRQRLVYAGYRSPTALQNFYGIRVISSIVLTILVLFVTRWLPGLSSIEVIIYAFIGAALGLVGPSYVLDKMVANRITKLRKAFPDALDLLVVCVESGLGLAAAIQRVADEIGVSHAELAAEMSLVNAEIRAGVDRTRALKNLADRTGLPDIRGLVSLLVQTMRFGTSVADALRVYSEEFRDRRMQAAEEQAAKIGTKLIFPLVLCLFPSFFTVAVGPAILRLVLVFRHF